MIVDSNTVNRVLAPASPEELADAIRSESGTIGPVGSGSALSLGNPLESIDSVVDTRKLNRITEYVPADLTVHVEAGVRLGELQDVLSKHNQMLPLDPWNGSNRTIGGIVATNAQGPLRTVGTARDSIIGMKVVDSDGHVSRTGGRVVKNVSGYDLAKLYVGSLGSLAVISEVSFKVSLRHQATADRRLLAPTPSDAFRIIRRIRESPLHPISLIWTGPENWIYVRFGDTATAVRWQLKHLPEGDWERLDGDTGTTALSWLTDVHDSLGDIVVRAVIPPSRMGEAIDQFQPLAWMAHAARGTVLMGLAPDRIQELRASFPAVIERAPLKVRRQIPTFGLRGAEHRLMAQIKNVFDPGRRLNPGRHVDGEPSV